MSHTCHAEGCKRPVPPRLFVCRMHWGKLSEPLKVAIWREYRPGQERDKQPSLRYLAVQTLARGELAFVPHDEAAAHLSANLFAAARVLREQAVAAGLGDPFEPIDLSWVQDLRT